MTTAVLDRPALPLRELDSETLLERVQSLLLAGCWPAGKGQLDLARALLAARRRLERSRERIARATVSAEGPGRTG